ncbi:hypothetical protein ACFWFZ_07780 [Streptomyces sp. NPDC060232]|uniref:hypothetical protein n=1 Tax=Streptomyces sp. NPDC060232 TaxID=3347079 RepID=UPI0036687CBC
MPPAVLAGLDPGLKDTPYQAFGGSEIRSIVFNVRPGSAAAPFAGREAVTGAQNLSDGTGVWRLRELDWL